MTRYDRVPLNSKAYDNVNKWRTDLLFFSCATKAILDLSLGKPVLFVRYNCFNP